MTTEYMLITALTVGTITTLALAVSQYAPAILAALTFPL